MDKLTALETFFVELKVISDLPGLSSVDGLAALGALYLGDRFERHGDGFGGLNRAKRKIPW